MAHSRRHFLARGLAGAATALTAGWTQRALAQGNRAPFGLPIPEELLRLVPEEPLALAQAAEAIVTLEREADVQRLPRSVLELATGQGLPASLDDLYLAALPRLVALIDRASAGRADGGLGDRAAELLARLHKGEHTLPEALAALAARTARPGMAALPMAVQVPVPLPDEVVVTMDSQPVVQPLPDASTDVPAEPGSLPPPVPDDPGQDLPQPARSLRFDDLADEYLAYFASLQVRPDRSEAAQWHLTMLRQSRRRYDAVAARTGVPWYFVGVTHGLEASFNFRGHLHNGDFPLTQRTRQVPAGRPAVWLPPSDWESSAADALRLMNFAGQSDWSLARTLHRLEAYNGFGYRRRGAATPYLWSFSQHYERGKFVADGRFNPAARSQQCGAAVMLKLLLEAGEISFG